MQAAQQTIVCPKPTDAQVQLQIETTHWQEKQQDLAGAWQRQNTTQQQAMEHQHYMIDHLVTPIAIVVIVAIIAVTAIYLIRRAIDADIQKNSDDNAADVVRAQEILDKARNS